MQDNRRADERKATNRGWPTVHGPNSGVGEIHCKRVRGERFSTRPRSERSTTCKQAGGRYQNRLFQHAPSKPLLRQRSLGYFATNAVPQTESAALLYPPLSLSLPLTPR